MDQILNQLVTIGRGIWRRRFAGMAVAWVIAIVGLIVVARIPDKYEAMARVFVDTDSVLKPLMSGLAVQPDVSQRVSILSRTLMSRPNMEKLIRMTDLDHSVTSSSAKESLIDDLLSTIKLEPAGLQNLYLIKIRDPNRDKTKRVVQSLLSIFMESSLGDKRKDSETAKEFIEEQISLYEKKLEESENRLKDFRLKHLGALAGGKDYFAKMDNVSSDLNNARLQLREAEQSRDSLKHEFAEQKAILQTQSQDKKASAPQPEIVVPEFDSRIQALKTELDDLLRKYTDQHPDVVQTRRIIGQLEEQRKLEVETRQKAQLAAAAAAGTEAPEVNPVLQQLKIGLSEAEASVAGLRARVGEYESRYQQLKAAAEQVPEIDNELMQLNRDYEVIKGQYASLVSRREAATMTGQMEETGGMANFRVIDPPRVSSTPVWPNRLLLLSLVFAAAIVGGAAASFAVSQILPTFSDAKALRDFTNRPVLGTVMLLESPAVSKVRRRRAYLFFGGFAGLVATYGMAAVFLLVIRPW